MAGSTADQAADELVYRRIGQRSEPYTNRILTVPAVGQGFHIATAAAAADGGSQQQRKLGRDLAQPVQQQERGRIGPLQVFNRHGERRSHAPLLDQHKCGVDDRILGTATPDKLEDLCGLAAAAFKWLQASVQGGEGQMLVELIRGADRDIRDEVRGGIEDCP
jgi:hypothetical protein